MFFVFFFTERFLFLWVIDFAKRFRILGLHTALDRFNKRYLQSLALNFLFRLLGLFERDRLLERERLLFDRERRLQRGELGGIGL